MSDIDWEPLVEAALKVRELAYAPYSSYRVGAALLADDGRTFIGCNVENAAFPVCLCAEQAAIGAAVASGSRSFVALVVATAGARPAPPCGMCRQALSELAADLPVLLVTPDGVREHWTLSKLLPGAFKAGTLTDGQG